MTSLYIHYITRR